MRRFFCVLAVTAAVGCTTFQAPGPGRKGIVPEAGSNLELDGAAVAHDYGNKLTL